MLAGIDTMNSFLPMMTFVMFVLLFLEAAVGEMSCFVAVLSVEFLSWTVDSRSWSCHIWSIGYPFSVMWVLIYVSCKVNPYSTAYIYILLYLPFGVDTLCYS